MSIVAQPLAEMRAVQVSVSAAARPAQQQWIDVNVGTPYVGQPLPDGVHSIAGRQREGLPGNAMFRTDNHVAVSESGIAAVRDALHAVDTAIAGRPISLAAPMHPAPGTVRVLVSAERVGMQGYVTLPAADPSTVELLRVLGEALRAGRRGGDDFRAIGVDERFPA